jgi:hypothetical protein
MRTRMDRNSLISIWLRARSHMTSHYTWGSVTTLHGFGGVLGWPLDTFFWGLIISWSHLFACMWSGPNSSHHQVLFFMFEATSPIIAWPRRGSSRHPLQLASWGSLGCYPICPGWADPMKGGGIGWTPNPSEAGVSLTYKIRVTSYASPSLPVSSPISHMPPSAFTYPAGCGRQGQI